MAVSIKQVYSELGDIKANYPKFSSYYSKINQLNISRLQEGVINRDLDYLKRVSTILHVIISICAKPHLNNRQEEIVARIEEAKKLENEDFSRVLKDGSLWKKYGIKMVPERVYYYQNVDLLAIYENRFIVLTIECLEAELDDYANFYVKLLPQITSGQVNLDNQAVAEKILKYIWQLKRRINYLKNTHFYKEVSKAKRISRNIERTNILLKDPLYSRVFRFYRKYLYTQERFLDYDFFKSYVEFYIHKELYARGFRLENGLLVNKNFEISFEDYLTNRGIIFNIKSRDNGLIATHLLQLSLSNWFSDIEKVQQKFDTIEAICPFGLAINERKFSSFDTILSEEKIISNYLDTKLNYMVLPTDIYGKYCPCCHAKSPLEQEGVYTCTSCSSRYLYQSATDGYSLWFLRQRRK